jgi:hypothetical protein
MVALGEIAKYPLDSFGIGVRADFQKLVIVDELRSCHFAFSVVFFETLLQKRARRLSAELLRINGHCETSLRK